jgi:hypothetical protein
MNGFAGWQVSRSGWMGGGAWHHFVCAAVSALAGEPFAKSNQKNL